MYKGKKVVAVMPALNEEKAIGKVVQGLKRLQHDSHSTIDQIIVCDNGSTDDTAAIAAALGAKVVYQPTAGYGIACLTALAQLPACDIVLFIDADDSCHVEQAERLLEGICQGDDLAIGARTLGQVEKGALTLPQRFGNALAAFLIRLLWRQHVSDLGPFRAIRQETLAAIHMQDKTFGWTVEMQIKCIQLGRRLGEYPVDSKCRIGKSKISGTVKGTINAGIGILGMIAKLHLKHGKYVESFQDRI